MSLRRSRPSSPIPPLTGIVRDPNDDVIVAAAMKAGADYLVTRDKDLLTLGSCQGIRLTQRFPKAVAWATLP